MSDDVVGVVARGIYAQVLKVSSGPEGHAPFFDMLPADARNFLRLQARSGLERLRQNVTDRMVAAVAELGLCRDEDAKTIFQVMLDVALSEQVN